MSMTKKTEKTEQFTVNVPLAWRLRTETEKRGYRNVADFFRELARRELNHEASRAVTPAKK